MQFLDEVVIHVRSGAGGEGHVSFRREKYVPRGGPDGGDGGRGGAVVLVATARRNTLVDYHRKRHWWAPDGERGGKRQCYGAAGEDLVLDVPLGTLVYDAETAERLADLGTEGASWRIPGGRGGLGNMHFASSTNRTPRQALPAEPGEERMLRLELKLLADIGLLGFPNAGKSTLLRRVSAARPKVADYPFTTLVPQLGVVELGDARTAVFADIPGLIAGAAEGAGLGHRFLKHVERCAGFVHLVSAVSWEGSPAERFMAIVDELRCYGGALADRPQVVVLTKIDLVSEAERKAAARALREVSGARVFGVCGLTGDGVAEMLGAVRALLDAVGADRPAPIDSPFDPILPDDGSVDDDDVDDLLDPGEEPAPDGGWGGWGA